MVSKTLDALPVGSVEELGKLGHRMKWKYFERIVAFVFERNDYKVSVSVVRKSGMARRQYDVIAENPRHVFAADCKRWTGKRYKASLLKKAAAEMQVERCMLLKADYDVDVVPVIVTLLDEDVVIHEGVPIVPLSKLNAFLNTWEEDDEGIRRV